MWAAARVLGAPRGAATLGSKQRWRDAALRCRVAAPPGLSPAGRLLAAGAGSPGEVPLEAAAPSVEAKRDRTNADGAVPLRKSAGLYWKLSKGKLTTFVSMSALPGYLVAVPGAIDPAVFLALTAGTFLTSASAQAQNQLAEIPRDARMRRTMMRPLPSGQLTPDQAKAFAATSGAAGFGLLTVGATPASACVAGLTMATYVSAYTPMKVLTEYNTHVGAISGALPTLLGFTAALGTGIVASPWAAHAAWLFAMQTVWQMPHFYALAWLHRADYIKGGYRMFPLLDATGHATAAMSKPYLVALCAMPPAAAAMGLASWMLPIGAAVPSALWWRSLLRFEDNPTKDTCRKFFLGSLSYLLATLALFTIYARAEKPVEDGGDASAGGEQVEVELLEPAWRIYLAAQLGELCPHEQLRLQLFGLLGASCPFGAREPLPS